MCLQAYIRNNKDGKNKISEITIKISETKILGIVTKYFFCHLITEKYLN